MKKYLVICCFVFSIGITGADISNFTAQETFIGYYPSSNYANVIEYNLLSKNQNIISSDIELLKQLITASEYCSSQFNFNNFFSVEEIVTNEGNYIKGEYNLLTVEDDVLKNTEDLFTSVLKAKVDIKIEDNQIVMLFSGKDIQIGTNNATGAYKKGDAIKLIWSRTKSIELVFHRQTDNMNPIIQYITQNIKSPERTKEEIDLLKNSSPPLDKLEQEFQSDSDIIRLTHLRYYAELIEEYKKIKGSFPFQGESTIPCYVFIANKKQQKYVHDGNPDSHKVHSYEDFHNELEKVLGRKVDQKFDPQYVPTTKPSFYLYMINGDNYYFAIHISQHFEFSKKVSNNYYKVEVSNNTDDSMKIYRISDLVNNKSFLEVVSSNTKKNGFFIEREKKHLNEY